MKAAALASLEAQHSAALTEADSLPRGSKEHAAAVREAERIAQRINDWHERANPTPVA